MCPDPLADLEKMLCLAGYCPIISLLIALCVNPYYHASLLDDPTTIPIFLCWGIIWSIICVLYYFFMPGHGVFCGIPMTYPSRYEQMMHVKTAEEIQSEVETQNRFQEALDDLKEQGIVDKDRELNDLLPKVRP